MGCGAPPKWLCTPPKTRMTGGVPSGSASSSPAQVGILAQPLAQHPRVLAGAQQAQHTQRVTPEQLEPDLLDHLGREVGFGAPSTGGRVRNCSALCASV